MTPTRNPHGGALTLVYFGIVAIEPVLADIVTGKPELVVDLVHGMKRGDLASDDCFDRLVESALKLGVVVAVQKFGIDPASFPGRLAVFFDDEATFIPALLVGDRLIVWDRRDGETYATDKPARASEMRAALARAECEQMGAATQ